MILLLRRTLVHSVILFISAKQGTKQTYKLCG